MRIAGIICEYNPFHNGHRFHLAQTRKETGCEGIIAVMSGNFVQRGEPAAFCKQTRAELAAMHGADLVLELPTLFALRSADAFAHYAVRILEATGAASFLSFGAETGELPLLEQIAEVYAEEPEEFQSVLRRKLGEGCSFPRARGEALSAVLGERAAEAARLPNNLLAIEYLKAIRKSGTGMVPHLIRRTGAQHDSGDARGEFASAALIRQELWKGRGEQVQRFLPPLVRDGLQGKRAKQLKDFEQAILNSLCKYSPEELRELPEVTEGLEFKIYRAARECDTTESLLAQLKSKRYPLSRLRRLLLCAMLGIRREEQIQEVPYLKILAFNETGQRILHEMKKTASLPIVKHSGHIRKRCDESAMRFWQREQLFDRLYELG